MSQLTELDDSVETETSHGISRRTLVKGGLVAGGALWAVPAVQVLGMGKAFAATASVTPGNGKVVSYVMLVLKSGSTFFTLKVDKSGSVSCMADPDNGTSSGVLPTSSFTDNNAFDNYVTVNTSAWGTRDQASCTKSAVTASTTGGLVVTVGSAYTLVGYMVHDGGLHNDGGWKDRFAAGTNILGIGGPAPGASTSIPAGYSFSPLITTPGGTFTFAKN